MTFVHGVRIPDSKLAREITELVREVDGANAARKFLRSHDITRSDIDTG
jgi:hypothetical protein